MSNQYLEIDAANPSKLDAEFWAEFNETITDRGGPDDAYLAEHIAWNVVQGDIDFVEGVGPLKEMNITAREIDSDVTIEACQP